MEYIIVIMKPRVVTENYICKHVPDFWDTLYCRFMFRLGLRLRFRLGLGFGFGFGLGLGLGCGWVRVQECEELVEELLEALDALRGGRETHNGLTDRAQEEILVWQKIYSLTVFWEKK